MKKITKYKKYLIILGIIITSCQTDLYDLKQDEKQNIKIETQIKNGRFIFSSKESLKKTIDDFKQKDIKEVEKDFESFYKKGFYSLEPIVNTKNESLLNKMAEHINTKRQLSGKNIEDDDEILIKDPMFAAIVNDNNEIVVKDTLYKFVKDKGLYFSHIKDSLQLFNYLDKLNNKLYLDPCDLRTQSGGITNVNGVVSRYIEPIDDDGCGGYGGGGSGNGGNPSTPQLSEDEVLQNLVNNLPECHPDSGSWIINLFGKSDYCLSYFDDKHRIRTEYWDQSWLVYKSSGVLAKTQKKCCWIWWASSSDEIHLGINYVLLKYDNPAPSLSSINIPSNYNNTYQAPLYMYGMTMKVLEYESQYGPNYHYVESQMIVNQNKIPFFDIGNEDILNIYIPKIPIVGNYNLHLTTQSITSQSNLKALYKMGIDFLRSNFNSGASNAPKSFAVSHQKSDSEIEVIYFGEHFSGTNTNIVKKRFYQDVSFKIKWAYNNSPTPIYVEETNVFGQTSQVLVGTDYSGTSHFSIEPAPQSFRDYTYYELDFYGMAKRGNTWRGSRLIKH